MSKKDEGNKKSKHAVLLWYDNDWAETKALAEKIAKEDPTIIDKIPSNMIKIIKKNGIFTILIKTLVEIYVKQKKETYLNKHAKQPSPENSQT